MRNPVSLAVVLWGFGLWGAQDLSPLDRYIEESGRAKARAEAQAAGRGSLYTPEGPLAELGRDLRARLVDDVVAIVVSEQATALSRGATSSSRTSSTKHGVSALHGVAGGRLANLVNASGASELEGEGTTRRESTITTRLAGRVTHVLPNGNLVVEAHKEVVVNSERQLVSVRGVVRPADLARDNSVRSDRLAQMEIRINGKGVVNDAIRRPWFLWRILMGLLPF